MRYLIRTTRVFYCLAFAFTFLIAGLSGTANATSDNASLHASTATAFFDPPAPPTLLTPLDGAHSVPMTVPLRWTLVDGASRYNVQVATDHAFSSIVWSTNVPRSPVSFTAPTPNTTYYWRVQSVGPDGMSSFSAPFSFSLFEADECTLAAPTLLTPLNGQYGVSGSVALRWSPVEDADRYNVQVATDAEMQNLVFTTNVPTSPVTFVLPEGASTFYWHVQSANSDEMCAYSPVWWFTTGAEPDRGISPPELLTPLNGATGVNNPVVLRASPVDGAVRYNFQVAMDYAFSTIIYTENVPRSQVDFNTPNPGTVYYWRAQAVSEDEMSKFSKPYSFTSAGSSEIAQVGGEAALAVPETMALHDNFPNPFNPSTTITVDVPEATQIKLAVYDMLGNKVMQVASGSVEAGTHSYTIDASSLPSGVYLYRFEAPGFSETKQMTLLK